MYCNFKCGEVFCNSSTSFEISCILCQASIAFQEFLTHFENEHLSDKSCVFIDEDDRPLASLVEEAQDPLERISNNTDCPYKGNTKDENYSLKSTTKCNKSENENLSKRANENDTGQCRIKSENDESVITCDNKDIEEYINENVSDKDCKHETNTEKKEPLDDNASELEYLEGSEAEPNYTNEDENDDKPNTLNKSKKTHKDFSFACDHCDRHYKSKSSLQNHIRTKHNPIKREEGSKFAHKCNECGESFRMESHLRGHMWKHTGIFCNICGKQFTQAGNLTRHKIRHTGVKSFECKECGNTFFTEKELNAHMLRHTQAFPVICEICGRRCRDSGVLRAHMRRHTGERPAKCEVCGKSFYSFHDLNVHKVIHTKERPFVCDQCGATFQRKKSLRLHKKTHASEKGYVCTICGKGFTQSNGLNAHMRAHESAKCLNKLR